MLSLSSSQALKPLSDSFMFRSMSWAFDLQYDDKRAIRFLARLCVMSVMSLMLTSMPELTISFMCCTMGASKPRQ